MHSIVQHRTRTPVFWLVVGTTSIAFFMSQLDVTIVNLALPQIGSQFRTSTSGIQWIVDAYALALAVVMLAAGALGDQFGAKRIFQFGLLLFALCSAACGFAAGIVWLDIGRALQGAGAAIMLPNSLTLLNNALAHDPPERARAVGFWTASGSISLPLGALLSGVFVATVGWRWIFFVNIPFCALGLLLSSRLEDGGRPTQRRPLDPAGVASLTLALFGLTAAIIEMHPLGFSHPLVAGGLALALTGFGAFAWIEASIDHPVLPLAMLRRGNFRLAILFGMAVNLTYYGTIFALSLYFQKTLDYSPMRTACAFIPLTAGFLISNVLSGKVIARHGNRWPMMVGALLDATGFLLLFLTLPTHNIVLMLLPLLMIPAGMGLGVPAMTDAVLTAVGKERSGMGTAVLNTARQAAGALGVAIFGGLASAPGIVGMRIMTGVSCVILMLAVGIAHRMRQHAA